MDTGLTAVALWLDLLQQKRLLDFVERLSDDEAAFMAYMVQSGWICADELNGDTL